MVLEFASLSEIVDPQEKTQRNPKRKDGTMKKKYKSRTKKPETSLIEYQPTLKADKIRNKHKTNKNNQNQNQNHKQDVLCLLKNKDGQYIDTYIEPDVKNPQKNKIDKKVKSNAAWNGNWINEDLIFDKNTKQKTYSPLDEVDTYDLKFNGMLAESFHANEPISAIMSNETLMNDLYDLNYPSNSHTFPLFANNSEQMNLMGYNDLHSQKQNILNRKDNGSKSLFLEEDIYDYEDNENEDEDNENDYDRLSDIVGGETDEEDNYFENSPKEMSDWEQIDSDLNTDSDGDNDIQLRSYNHNEKNPSSFNDVTIILAYFFLGIFFIFLLEQFLYMGTYFIRHI